MDKDKIEQRNDAEPDNETVNVFSQRMARLCDVCEVWKSPLWFTSTQK